MVKTCFMIFFSLLFLQNSTAQNPISQFPKAFKAEQFEGTLGKTKITIQLYFINDSLIRGCYFYDNIGKLIFLIGKKDCLNLTLQTDPFNQYEHIEDEKFIAKAKLDSLNNYIEIVGTWEMKEKRLDFSLKRTIPNLNWRYFSLNIKDYNYKFCNELHNQEINFIYPSFQSSPKLNKSIQSLFTNNENTGTSRKYIELINSQNSNSLKIIEEYDNDLAYHSSDCYYSLNNGSIDYFSDSLTSYRISSLRDVIGVHLWSDEYFVVFNNSTGEKLHFSDIINKDYNKEVLDLTTYEYDTQFNGDSISINYSDLSFLFAPGGIYLIHYKQCNMCTTEFYFIPFKKLKPYLNEAFRYLTKE